MKAIHRKSRRQGYPTKIKAPTFNGKQSWTKHNKLFEAAAAGRFSVVMALRGDSLDIIHTITESDQ